MAKILTHIVALFLVPCLLVDPTLATSLQHPLSPRERAVAAATWERGTDGSFLQQAVSPPAQVGTNIPIENPAIKAATNVAAEAQLGIPVSPAQQESPPGAGIAPGVRHWRYLYEVRGRDLGANRTISLQEITPFVDLRAIPTYLPEFNQIIAQYRALRANDRGLAEIMEPLDKPVGVFEGNVLTPGIRAVSVGSPLVGLNLAAFAKKGESPWLAVFCLRHSAARRISAVPYWDTVFDDAEFIRALKPVIGDHAYDGFLKELQALLDDWPDKSGYLDLLQRISGRSPSDELLVRTYLETKLILGSEPAIWGVTMDADMVRSLQARLGQLESGPVGLLVFESLLAKAGALSLESRHFIQHLVDDLERAHSNPGLLEQVQAEHVSYVKVHPELIQVLADISRVAIKIHSPLNAAVGLDREAQEQFAYLERLAIDVNRILGETDEPRARRVLTDNAIERLYWRVRHLLHSPSALMNIVSNELSALAGDAEFAQESGRLLLNNG